MDGFDKYRAGQMPALKNLMQMTTLTFRSTSSGIQSSASYRLFHRYVQYDGPAD